MKKIEEGDWVIFPWEKEDFPEYKKEYEKAIDNHFYIIFDFNPLNLHLGTIWPRR